MKKSKSTGKRRHYVPEFYLERWANNDGRIRVFDKKKTRVFESPAKHTAVSKNFYKFPVVRHDQRILDYDCFSDIETEASIVIKEILSNNRLTQEQIGPLSSFVWLQFLRTEKFTQFLKAMTKYQNKKVKELYGPKYGIVCYDYRWVNYSLFMNKDIPISGDFFNFLSSASFGLISNRGIPFITSDDPVQILSIDRKKSSGIVFFPLCPETCLIIASKDQRGFFKSFPSTDRTAYINSLIMQRSVRFVYAKDEKHFFGIDPKFLLSCKYQTGDLKEALPVPDMSKFSRPIQLVIFGDVNFNNNKPSGKISVGWRYTDEETGDLYFFSEDKSEAYMIRGFFNPPNPRKKTLTHDPS